MKHDSRFSKQEKKDSDNLLLGILDNIFILPHFSNMKTQDSDADDI